MQITPKLFLGALLVLSSISAGSLTCQGRTNEISLRKVLLATYESNRPRSHWYGVSTERLYRCEESSPGRG